MQPNLLANGVEFYEQQQIATHRESVKGSVKKSGFFGSIKKIFKTNDKKQRVPAPKNIISSRRSSSEDNRPLAVLDQVLQTEPSETIRRNSKRQNRFNSPKKDEIYERSRSDAISDADSLWDAPSKV